MATPFFLRSSGVRPQRFAGRGSACALALSSILWCGCAGEPGEEDLLRIPRPEARGTPSAAPAADSGDGPGAAALSAAVLDLPGWDGAVRLREGAWNAPSGGGWARLAEGLVVQGDFDGDGESETAGVVTLGVAGPDIRLYLVAAGPQGTSARQEAALLLGTRVQVRGLRAGDGAVEVELVTFAAGDDPCCPTRVENRRYRIRDGGWVPG